MHRRSWYLGVIVGLLAGLLVSIPMTAANWRLNPSGIFHDEQGTDWTIVAETAFSWFWPVALIVLVPTVTIHSWITRVRNRKLVIEARAADGQSRPAGLSRSAGE